MKKHKVRIKRLPGSQGLPEKVGYWGNVYPVMKYGGLHKFIYENGGGVKGGVRSSLEQSIIGTKKYFEPNFLSDPKVEFVKILGSYSSLVDFFSSYFDINSNTNKHENILAEIFNKYHSINDNNGILFLLIDEFGKFLEFASKNNPENELYFIQQLAEFCNNPKHNIILITTVHQSFESYAYSLNSSQKQEWIKVKGRFREITFNEPVEQLLFLASEHIAYKNLNNNMNRKFY